ncbi:hypothetical protein [Amycolatopsis sp. H20-H5]|uniref:hypothetical protein n=1 Tax=Amycolatopsis sp. H20-H5 TaxID=3046309 RepID=UPI002DBB38E8|nr:hypothetical protein [Amycolatopsis sp. H20-H5]MEC3981866.1 hypothetical protein [Amycolatopsis sp. H20-H5]
MTTVIDVTGFEPAYAGTPWWDFLDLESAEFAANWALQAMKITTVGLQAQERTSATWDEFELQLMATFENRQWQLNAIVQRLLQAAKKLESANVMLLTDEHWVYAGDEACQALKTWPGQVEDLLLLAQSIGVDPVEYEWVAAAEPEVAAEESEVAAEQPEFARDFARYLTWHLSASSGLPDAATVGSWFGKDLLPEAIVARFDADFPQGVTTSDGTVLSIQDVGVFYLGAQNWAKTNLLQDETLDEEQTQHVIEKDLDPKFVQEILSYFSSDEPLKDAEMARVKEAIDAGIITFEDD